MRRGLEQDEQADGPFVPCERLTHEAKDTTDALYIIIPLPFDAFYGITPMILDSGTALAAVAMVVGAIVWLVRLEGRINVTDVRYDEIIERLARIERKQDGE